MRTMIPCVLTSLLWLGANPAAVQTPPQVLVERYLDAKPQIKPPVLEKGRDVEAERHGYWVERFANGDIHEGSYVDGKKHGQWITRAPSGYGDAFKYEFYVNGELVARRSRPKTEKGSLVDGKKKGDWVVHDVNGNMEKGPYLAGKRHGQWVIRDRDGNVKRVSYLQGQRAD